MPLTLPIFQCRPAALVSRHPLQEFPLTQNRAHTAPSLISLILHENPEFASLLSKKPVNPVIFSWIFIFYLADSTFSGKLASLPAS